jgi:hypothetical protein
MSEMGDMWRELKEESKLHRHSKQEWSKELLAEWCEWNIVEMKEIAAWQIRLTKESKRIDIYPQRQRYFDLVAQKWGNYKELIAFISKHFQVAHVQIKPFKEDSR